MPYLAYAGFKKDASCDSGESIAKEQDQPKYQVTLSIAENDDEHVVKFKGIETLAYDKGGLVSELYLLYELVTTMREHETLQLDQSEENQQGQNQECN